MRRLSLVTVQFTIFYGVQQRESFLLHTAQSSLAVVVRVILYHHKNGKDCGLPMHLPRFCLATISFFQKEKSRGSRFPSSKAPSSKLIPIKIQHTYLIQLIRNYHRYFVIKLKIHPDFSTVMGGCLLHALTTNFHGNIYPKFHGGKTKSRQIAPYTCLISLSVCLSKLKIY